MLLTLQSAVFYSKDFPSQKCQYAEVENLDLILQLHYVMESKRMAISIFGQETKAQMLCKLYKRELSASITLEWWGTKTKITRF